MDFDSSLSRQVSERTFVPTYAKSLISTVAPSSALGRSKVPYAQEAKALEARAATSASFK